MNPSMQPRPQSQSEPEANLVNFPLSSRYQFVKILGKGAYGVVAHFKDTIKKEDVAIKRVPLNAHYRYADEAITEAKKILRELKILHNFRHPNIIGIKHAIVQKEAGVFYIYMVSRLMDADLQRVIARSELTDEHIKYIMYQIMRGLNFLHRANVIHRDIKPNNILATEDCDIVLCDLGFAREVEQMGLMTEYVVTRVYRAPEIILCPRHYTEQADIWAIGCTFFELMTKHILFKANSYRDLIVQIIKLLGSPTDRDLQFIENDSAKKFVRDQGFFPPGNLDIRLNAYPNPEAVNLLKQCLTFDPKRRISAEDALKHPYFKDYFEPDHIHFTSPQVDFSFEVNNISQKQILGMILNEIRVINEFAGEIIALPPLDDIMPGQ